MDNVFDVRLPGTDDKVSVIINVEGQNDDGYNKYISKRAEYHISRLVSRQKGSKSMGPSVCDPSSESKWSQRFLSDVF